MLGDLLDQVKFGKIMSRMSEPCGTRWGRNLRQKAGKGEVLHGGILAIEPNWVSLLPHFTDEGTGHG